MPNAGNTGSLYDKVTEASLHDIQLQCDMGPRSQPTMHRCNEVCKSFPSPGQASRLDHSPTEEIVCHFVTVVNVTGQQ